MNEPDNEHKPPESKMKTGCIFAFLGLIFGASLGAVFLSLLLYLYYVFFMPDILKDGQFALAFLVTVPLGAWVGEFLGIGVGLHCAEK